MKTSILILAMAGVGLLTACGPHASETQNPTNIGPSDKQPLSDSVVGLWADSKCQPASSTSTSTQQRLNYAADGTGGIQTVHYNGTQCQGEPIAVDNSNLNAYKYTVTGPKNLARGRLVATVSGPNQMGLPDQNCTADVSGKRMHLNCVTCTVPDAKTKICKSSDRVLARVDAGKSSAPAVAKTSSPAVAPTSEGGKADDSSKPGFFSQLKAALTTPACPPGSKSPNCSF